MKSVVYFIQADEGPIKIGITRNLKRRFETMLTHTPRTLRVLGTCDGAEEVEHSLHGMFAAHRLNGEWFSPAPEILEWVAGNCASPDFSPRRKPDLDCAFTREAADWINRICDIRITSGCANRRAALKTIAADLGVVPGVVENIVRNRLVGVLASHHRAINELLIDELKRRADFLQAELINTLDRMPLKERIKAEIPFLTASLASAAPAYALATVVEEAK